MWQELRTVEASANAYDRHVLEDGRNRAAVWRNGPNLVGFTLAGGLFKIPIPPVGNVQALRIRGLNGRWIIYAWVDPRDGLRAEYAYDVGPM